MKKISQLSTQNFLGGANVPANSYVLINYADSNSATPVTKKVSVQELGKAIVNDQQLYKKTGSGAVTTSVNNNAYVNGTAEALVTSSEKDILERLEYYMIAGDSSPHLILRAYPHDVGSKIITNGFYYDSNNYSGLPVVYDSTTSTLKYIDSNDSLTDIEISGGQEDSENTVAPSVTNIDDVTYSYLFYDPENKTFFAKDSNGYIASIPMVTYDYLGEQFNSIDSSGNLSIPMAPSIATVENNEYSYVFYDYTSNKFYAKDSGGTLVEVGTATLAN